MVMRPAVPAELVQQDRHGAALFLELGVDRSAVSVAGSTSGAASWTRSTGVSAAGDRDVAHVHYADDLVDRSVVDRQSRVRAVDRHRTIWSSGARRRGHDAGSWHHELAAGRRPSCSACRRRSCSLGLSRPTFPLSVTRILDFFRGMYVSVARRRDPHETEHESAAAVEEPRRTGSSAHRPLHRSRRSTARRGSASAARATSARARRAPSARR